MATPKIVILGAGVTGLTAAYELQRQSEKRRSPVEIVVLESSTRAGGKIFTERRDGAVIEAGPDSFITTKPHALELVHELGLSGDLVKTNAGTKTIYVCVNGRLRALPDGMSFLPTRVMPFLLSDLITWKAKGRMLREPWIPAELSEHDESLASFVRRRLGDEALDLVVGPMLAGIYAGDAEQLSVSSTFPQLRQMERDGGLLRALWKARRPAKAADSSLFMSLAGGMSKLTDTLAAKLPPGCLKLGQGAQSLRRRGGRWQVQTAAGVVEADAVISTLPANVLAKVTNDLDPELACVLAEIPFATTATVSTVFDRDGFPNPLDGYGFLVPKGEPRAITAATFSSSKFPGRVDDKSVLIRAFLGGVGREGPAEAQDDSQIARAARGDLKDLLGLGERHPRLTRTFRYPKGNPQYTVGHGLRLKRIESCLRGHPALALAGSSYHGVGLPDCVRSGREAAAKILSALPAGAPAGVA